MSQMSDVKCWRPKWPRGQIFGLGLGLKDLVSDSASTSNIWPRSRCLIM